MKNIMKLFAKRLACAALALAAGILQPSAAEAAQARVDATEYATLAEAFAAAPNGATITLLENVTVADGTLVADNGRTLTLAFAGQKLTVTAGNLFAVDEGASLTLTDAEIAVRTGDCPVDVLDGELVVASTAGAGITCSKAWVYFVSENRGTLRVSGAFAISEICDYNYGTVEVDGCQFTGDYLVYENYRHVMARNCQIDVTYYVVTFTGESEDDEVCVSTFEGCDVTLRGFNGMFCGSVYADGELTVSGCAVRSEGNLQSSALAGIEGVLSVSNSTIDCSFIQVDEPVIDLQDGGLVTLENVTIVGSGPCVSLEGDAAQLTLAGAELTAGGGKPVFDNVVEGDARVALAPGYKAVYDTVSADDWRLASRVSVVESGGAEARVGTEEYATLAEAFAEAPDGATITLLKDVRLFDGPLEVDDGRVLTLDFAGRKIYVFRGNLFAVDEGASLTLTDAEIAVEAEDCPVDVLDGELVVASTAGAGVTCSEDCVYFVSENRGTLRVSGSFAIPEICDYNYGTVEVDGCQFAGEYFIYENHRHATVRNSQIDVITYVVSDTGNSADGEISVSTFEGSDVTLSDPYGRFCSGVYPDGELAISGCTIHGKALDWSAFAGIEGVLTVGNSTIDCSFIQVDKPVIDIRDGGRVTFANATIVGSGPCVSLQGDASRLTLAGAELTARDGKPVFANVVEWDARVVLAPGYKAVFDMASATDWRQNCHVSVVAGGAEARVGTVEYATLAEAFAAAPDGATITLLQDVGLVDEPLVVDDGRTLTLDFAGRKIYVLRGDLFEVDEGASLTLTNAEIDVTGEDYPVNVLDGELVVASTAGAGITSSGGWSVYFVSENRGTLRVSGTFDISEVCDYNYGTVEVDGCQFTGDYFIYQNHRHVTARNSQIDVNNYVVGYTGESEDGEVCVSTVEGCDVTLSDPYGRFCCGVYPDGELTVDGCTIHGKALAWSAFGGIEGLLTVSDSTMNCSFSKGDRAVIEVLEGGLVTLENATVVGSGACVSLQGAASQLTIARAELKAGGGKPVIANSWEDDARVELAPGFGAVFDTASADDWRLASRVSVLVPSGGAEARVDATEYATLAEAFAEAPDGATITLLKDVRLFDGPLEVDDGRVLSLDFAGQKIYVFRGNLFAVDAGASLTLTDAEIAVDTQDHPVNVLDGELVVASTAGAGVTCSEDWVYFVSENRGTLRVSGAFAISEICDYNYGTVEVDGCQFTGDYFVYENYRHVMASNSQIDVNYCVVGYTESEDGGVCVSTVEGCDVTLRGSSGQFCFGVYADGELTVSGCTIRSAGDLDCPALAGIEGVLTVSNSTFDCSFSEGYQPVVEVRDGGFVTLANATIVGSGPCVWMEGDASRLTIAGAELTAGGGNAVFDNVEEDDARVTLAHGFKAVFDTASAADWRLASRVSVVPMDITVRFFVEGDVLLQEQHGKPETLTMPAAVPANAAGAAFLWWEDASGAPVDALSGLTDDTDLFAVYADRLIAVTFADNGTTTVTNVPAGTAFGEVVAGRTGQAESLTFLNWRAGKRVVTDADATPVRQPVTLAAIYQSYVFTYDDLAAALAREDQDIVLAADVEVTNTLVATSSCRIRSAALPGDSLVRPEGFADYLFSVSGEEVRVTLENVTVDGRRLPAERAAIEVGYGATLVLTNMTVRDNYNIVKPSKWDTTEGGGVWSFGRLEVCDGTRIEGNRADAGGGIYFSSSRNVESSGTYPPSLWMYGGEIVGNQAFGYGHAGTGGGGVCIDHNHNGVCVYYAHFYMYGGRIAENVAVNGCGGGVALGCGDYWAVDHEDNSGEFEPADVIFTLYGGEISGNVAKERGGGVYVACSSFKMTGGEIRGNHADRTGGGLQGCCACAVNVDVTGGRITGNTCGEYGGGVGNRVRGRMEPELLGGNAADMGGDDIIGFCGKASLHTVCNAQLPRPAGELGVLLDSPAGYEAPGTVQVPFNGWFYDGDGNDATWPERFRDLGSARFLTAGSPETFEWPDLDSYDKDYSGFKAIWHGLALVYDANTGAGSEHVFDDQAYRTGANAVTKEGMFSRKGFVFTGWNTQADGFGTAYGPDAEVTMDAPKVLYAQWEEAPLLAYSNIHGLLKIETAYTTNTVIPAPWTDYTRDGSPTNDIRVDRMVKPRNLTDGDLLLQYANGGVYRAWVLEKDAGEEGVWTPMNTVRQRPLVGGTTNTVDSFAKGDFYVKPDGTETQKRGYGLWLQRQNPLDAQGNPVPFYLYGQWLTGSETVTIGGTNADDVAIAYPGAQYGFVHDTMLANPDCTHGTTINDYPWEGCDGADTIILNHDSAMHEYCFRLQKSKRSGGGWLDGWWQFGLSGYTTDGIATPAGVGFWYERRAAGPMTHTWAGAAKYPGDGEDHDVWIVDHADAGDGKTHLAIKLEGALVPEGGLTAEYIRELFDAGCIRYLHATGETQAEGKQMMDDLTAALPESARPVPYLRNGTGVNTAEELAKGWIWVTVDATDGTNAADPEKDGTGDTNGAGDLWRIVVAKGVWAPYTVRYLEDGTTNVLHASKAEWNRLVGETVTENALDLSGESWRLVGDAMQSRKLVDPLTGENVIVFYYEKKSEPTTYKYTVICIDMYTDEKLIPDIPGSGAPRSTITIEAPKIPGYQPLMDKISFELTQDGLVVVFLYYEDYWEDD